MNALSNATFSDFNKKLERLLSTVSIVKNLTSISIGDFLGTEKCVKTYRTIELCCIIMFKELNPNFVADSKFYAQSSVEPCNDYDKLKNVFDELYNNLKLQQNAVCI